MTEHCDPPPFTSNLLYYFLYDFLLYGRTEATKPNIAFQGKKKRAKKKRNLFQTIPNRSNVSSVLCDAINHRGAAPRYGRNRGQTAQIPY